MRAATPPSASVPARPMRGFFLLLSWLNANGTKRLPPPASTPTLRRAMPTSSACHGRILARSPQLDTLQFGRPLTLRNANVPRPAVLP